PFNAFANITDTAQKGKIFSFAVDALNGKIWAVDGSEKKYLASTSWTRGRADQPTSLIYKLNYILSDGCYSVLDLDQSTRGLAVSSPGRYALFGGKNKVVFTKTNKSLQTTTDFSVSAGAIPAPQTVIEDFSSDENFLETNLPSGAGAVIALEYSRRLAASGEQNYFFAGTQNGLYVFANNLKKGFTVDANVDDLNVAPFNGSWYKFDGIQGSVITIKTSGRGDDGDEQGALYVLTTQVGTTAQRPLISKIYKIPFDVNITDMETATVLLAESGIQETGSDLNSIKAIFDMELISTEINGNIKEQLVIATNQGLYRSTTAENTLSQDGIIDATDQEDAKWKPINTDDTSMYSALFGIDNAYNKTTIWPVQIADKKGANSFTRSSITQLNGTEISNDYLFVPEHFNATCQHKQFKTLLETTFFWSDGARRFFIVRPEQTGQGNRLLILPFNTADWFVNNPNTVLSDPSLNTACSFNWVQQIGASGQLIVGANNGVISLNGGGLIDLPFDAMV
ncbi:hypothetical protein KAH94_00845, partial [bacterium]|nr:hypothetical protein [bacterium]